MGGGNTRSPHIGAGEKPERYTDDLTGLSLIIYNYLQEAGYMMPPERQVMATPFDPSYQEPEADESASPPIMGWQGRVLKDKRQCWALAKSIIDGSSGSGGGSSGGGASNSGIQALDSSIDGRIALWDGDLGNLLKVGEKSLSDFATSDHGHSGVYAEKNHAHDERYATIAHTHDSDYAGVVHTHDQYEPKIGPRRSGFNLDIGVTEGTLAAGNHTHPFAGDVVSAGKPGGQILTGGTAAGESLILVGNNGQGKRVEVTGDGQVVMYAPSKTVITRSTSCTTENMPQNSDGDKFLYLPGVARYNAGFGLVKLYRDGVLLTPGVHYYEDERPETARLDDTTAYWSNRVKMINPIPGATYTLFWTEITINTIVSGLREAVVSPDHTQDLTNPHWASVYQVDNHPNGIAWNDPPEGCVVEIWRKTRQKNRGGHEYGAFAVRHGPRWVLWHTCAPGQTAVNFSSLHRFNGKGSRTEVFRFAYKDALGGRTPLSIEAAVYHGGKGAEHGKGWGKGKAYVSGLCRLK